MNRKEQSGRRNVSVKDDGANHDLLLVQGGGSSVRSAQESGAIGVGMKMDKRQKQEQKQQRTRLKRAVRKILIERHKVNAGMLGGFPGLRRYVLQFRPELSRFHGYEVLAAFLGEPATTKAEKTARKNTATNVNSDAFLMSYEWRRVRMQALTKYGARCQCCGATPADGRVMNVDHIKPRRIYPQLALDIKNLQVLCDVCNHGKGNWDMTDWRKGDGEGVQDAGGGGRHGERGQAASDVRDGVVGIPEKGS